MTDAPYQVLARKYRPQTFDDLIGQDAMVRVLRNAFAADRIAQAFILTGIRGTGKTTTARIIAKGMNCVGPDGQGGPTVAPCGECEPCRAIAEGRHVDVLEMDGASQTGVGDIRESIIGSVQYAPASARYKIYIIDEVHMLSASAFNALLKTLEEPPAHVKFIFATTEIRKVPVTVLSRCQRFDLRRVEPDVMIAHLEAVADREGARLAQDALALLARAAEGSVRDALSLLDQAVAHGEGETTAGDVRAMLGLADRGRVLDLFDMIMRGDASGALAEIGAQYADGADPLAILRDLSEVTHRISMVKITPEAVDDPTIGPDERSRGLDMAERLAMRSLTRMWQMLLKALEEVAGAPNAMMAAEMAVIRLTHVAELPPPGDLVRRLKDAPAPGSSAPAGQASAPATPAPASDPASRAPAPGPAASGPGTRGATALAHQPEESLARYARFEQVVELIRANRDAKLLIDVETSLRLAAYVPGRIEFQPTETAPQDLAARLSGALGRWTGVRWAVTVVAEGGGETIAEERGAEENALRRVALEHPMMQAVVAAFPEARITSIRTPDQIAAEAAQEALPEVDDEWDPFADD